jgi:multidrug efflux pump subunit AcrB
VKVRLPREEREFEYNLEQMILWTPAGREVPLRDAVSLKRGRAYTTIDRRNGRRVVTVSADVKPRSKTDQVMQSLTADTLPALQQKYPGLAASFEGRQADRRESMRGLLIGLLMALVVIYGLLAIPFNSFVQPMIIMMSIPFGIVGAVIGHLIMGYSLSVMSTFGVVALSGVVINGALVLIDFANRRRREGKSSHAAIYAAGMQRFRPMMAISLGFGILFAAFITLLLVPALYLINEDLRRLIGQGTKYKTPYDLKTHQ